MKKHAYEILDHLSIHYLSDIDLQSNISNTGVYPYRCPPYALNCMFFVLVEYTLRSFFSLKYMRSFVLSVLDVLDLASNGSSMCLEYTHLKHVSHFERTIQKLDKYRLDTN